MGFSQGYGPADDKVSHQTMAEAVKIGCTFWDTAVVYGKGHNETLLGEFIKTNNCRDRLFIASKCGFDVSLTSPEVARSNADWQCLQGAAAGTSGLGGVTNKPDHIKAYIEGTKERLGSYPDLYYLHRIDPNTPLEESIPALQALKTSGKTKYIGLSECSAATLRKACSSKLYHGTELTASRPHRCSPDRVFSLVHGP